MGDHPENHMVAFVKAVKRRILYIEGLRKLSKLVSGQLSVAGGQRSDVTRIRSEQRSAVRAILPRASTRVSSRAFHFIREH
jgi:hypothetical protein